MRAFADRQHELHLPGGQNGQAWWQAASSARRTEVIRANLEGTPGRGRSRPRTRSPQIMPNKNDKGGLKEDTEPVYQRTRMRSPFTAETPNEYNQAEWIPPLRSWPDVSKEEPAEDVDPVGFLPWNRKRRK